MVRPPRTYGSDSWLDTSNIQSDYSVPAPDLGSFFKHFDAVNISISPFYLYLIEFGGLTQCVVAPRVRDRVREVCCRRIGRDGLSDGQNKRLAPQAISVAAAVRIPR